MTERMERPLIWIGRADYGRLLRAVEGLAAREPELSAVLSRELERAIVRPDADLPRSVVRMGSRVLFRRADGVEPEWAVLVYPDQQAGGKPADGNRASGNREEAGRIAVASPLGTALLGLREGDRMAYRDADGTASRLSVERVLPA